MVSPFWWWQVWIFYTTLAVILTILDKGIVWLMIRSPSGWNEHCRGRSHVTESELEARWLRCEKTGDKKWSQKNSWFSSQKTLGPNFSTGNCPSTSDWKNLVCRISVKTHLRSLGRFEWREEMGNFAFSSGHLINKKCVSSVETCTGWWPHLVFHK